MNFCWRYLILDVFIGLFTVFMVSGKPITKTTKTALLNSHFQSLKGKSITNLVKQTSVNVPTKLYSNHLGTYVRITSSGITAKSVASDHPDVDIFIETLSAKRLMIKSKNGYYVCFDQGSAVIVKKTFDDKCLFNQMKTKNGYTAFQSHYNNTWYLAFSSKNDTYGLTKLGRKTTIKQKAVAFLKS